MLLLTHSPLPLGVSQDLCWLSKEFPHLTTPYSRCVHSLGSHLLPGHWPPLTPAASHTAHTPARVQPTLATKSAQGSLGHTQGQGNAAAFQASSYGNL